MKTLLGKEVKLEMSEATKNNILWLEDKGCKLSYSEQIETVYIDQKDGTIGKFMPITDESGNIDPADFEVEIASYVENFKEEVYSLYAEDEIFYDTYSSYNLDDCKKYIEDNDLGDYWVDKILIDGNGQHLETIESRC